MKIRESGYGAVSLDWDRWCFVVRGSDRKECGWQLSSGGSGEE